MPAPTARRGLDWLNFFHAAAQPGFGLFIAVYLTERGNAAMASLALNGLAQRGGNTGLVITAAIVVPQIVAALIAPWISGAAQRFGRRPPLLASFLVLPVRGLLLAAQPDAVAPAAMQALDGVSAAVLGIMVPLIAADVTRRTGYLNLAISSIGLAASIGATFAATCLVWLALPETRPARRAKARPSGLPA
jgi:MFS family permease